MEIKRFETNNRMSKVVSHNNTLYLCGQVHDSGDVSEQTAQILSKIEAILNEYGSDKEHILSATIYLKDIKADFAAMNAVWDSYFEGGFAPARACVEASMARDCLLVEMTITAAVK